MRIVVAGGTGTVGRHTVEAVRAAGHDAVVLSRSRGVDLVTGERPGPRPGRRGRGDRRHEHRDAQSQRSDRVLHRGDREPGRGSRRRGGRTLRAVVDRRDRPHALRLLRRQDRPGEGRRGVARSVDDPASDAVPRVRRRRCSDGRSWARSTSLSRPGHSPWPPARWVHARRPRSSATPRPCTGPRRAARGAAGGHGPRVRPARGIPWLGADAEPCRGRRWPA